MYTNQTKKKLSCILRAKNKTHTHIGLTMVQTWKRSNTFESLHIMPYRVVITNVGPFLGPKKNLQFWFLNFSKYSIWFNSNFFYKKFQKWDVILDLCF